LKTFLCLAGSEAAAFDKLSAQDAQRHKQDTLLWEEYTTGATFALNTPPRRSSGLRHFSTGIPSVKYPQAVRSVNYEAPLESSGLYEFQASEMKAAINAQLKEPV
jgi:hypothetical protein